MASIIRAALLFLAAAHAATIQHVTDTLDNNPTSVGFYLYVPDKLAPRPAILVNPHSCHGSAQAAYAGSQFAAFADKYGFVVIYPDSPHQEDKCWDVSSKETLSHNGGGDSRGIVSMVDYALAKYNGDRGRVFVTGVSSGAMMTSVLVGAYPDVFAAGSAYSGVPFSCFRAPESLQSSSNGSRFGYWNADCATGKVTKTAAAWAADIANAYPGYCGWRPKMQIFHGTADETLNYTCFTEEVKQWNAVFGFSQTPTSVVANTPKANWTRSVYGHSRSGKNWFEAYSAGGVTHNIEHQDQLTLDWFDLACNTTAGGCFRWGDK
ncbi:feruloyl esterase b [Ophiostoma piceae UAMH 11346]|uniref:Carboxylic ester hydrolase n=1 Tax=Ophiostoma piceae (strain UAMH 11346) TaxID=1262450 RepID=S3CZK3_OPHP1|nr:feruloyl esterase b [Ophiostoma piceae UAMH 11346]